jgi:hypothetical protein
MASTAIVPLNNVIASGSQAGRRNEMLSGIYERGLARRNQTSVQKTQEIQFMLERILLELCMNRFDWQGFPDTVNLRWLEMCLNYDALSVFYKHPDNGALMAVAGMPHGGFNMVGEPVEYVVYGPNNEISESFPAEECVPIWANYLHWPEWDLIQIYAARLAEIDRTLEINALQARRTKIITVNEVQGLTVDNINKQINDGAAAVKVKKGVVNIQDVIQNLDLGITPESITNLHIFRSREWNEIMGLLGINNANQDKKERLVAAEVSGNDDMVAIMRATRLQSRQQAADQINAKFGLNVTVEYTTSMQTAELKDTNREEDSGQENSE